MLSQGIIIILLILYLYCNVKYTNNIPYNFDDFVILLTSFKPYLEGDISAFEYLHLTKNKHPQIIERFTVLVSYFTTNGVNIKLILFLNNLSSIALLLIYRYLYSVRSQFLLVMLSIIVLVPSFPNFIWASASGLYIYPMIFLLLCFKLCENPTIVRLVLFFCCTYLMIYSFGSGIIGIPIICMYLGHLLFIKKLKFNWAAGYLSAIFIVLLFYFMQTGHESRSSSLDEFLTSFFQDPLKFFVFVFAYFGSELKYLNANEFIFSSIFGFCISVFSAYKFFKEYRNIKILPHIYMLIYVFSTGIVAGIFRAYRINGYVVPPRYAWYGTMAFISILMIISLSKKFELKLMVPLFLAISCIGFVKYEKSIHLMEVVQYRKRLQLSRYLVNPEKNFLWNLTKQRKNFVDKFNSEINWFLDNNIYDVPKQIQSYEFNEFSDDKFVNLDNGEFKDIKTKKYGNRVLITGKLNSNFISRDIYLRIGKNRCISTNLTFNYPTLVESDKDFFICLEKGFNVNPKNIIFCSKN